MFVEQKWFQRSMGFPRLMTTHIPAVLHACTDSRKMGLKNYKLFTSKMLEHPVYFDEEKDTLAFRTAVTWNIFLSTFDFFNDDPLGTGLRSIMLMGPPTAFFDRRES